MTTAADDTPTARPTPRRGRSARTATAAIVSQGIVAASSLVLQWLALTELGRTGLADFAILSNGLVVTATALHTGWVGDSLVILDRFDPPVRRALFRAGMVASAASLAFGFGGALAFTSLDVPTALLFGAALCAWLLEETGRRTMMARLEFVQLVVNDVVYALGALGVVGVVMVTGELTMAWLVGAMLSGATAATVVARLQLPAEEYARPGPGPVAMRELAAFSTWRSGQLTMRPLGMLLSRVAVKTFVSASALGLLEAGRLMIAPILTAANGFGGFSLPFFTRRRDQDRLDLALVAKFSLVSAAGAALYFPVALVAAPFFEEQSGTGAIPTLLVLSWCVYAVGYSANIPLVNALTSLLHSRSVFWGRCVDSAVIIVLTAVVAVVWGVEGVPFAMVVGMVIGTAIPLATLKRRGQLPGWRSPSTHREPDPSTAAC